jgi:putative acetyltransferase
MMDGADDLSFAFSDPKRNDVIALLSASDAYMAGLYPAESNHMLDVETLRQPDIRFLIVERGGTAVGCGAIRIADSYGELKRMWVDPALRGRRLGVRILEALIAEAGRLNLPALRLETGISQPEALGLYARFGFVNILPFGEYKSDPLSVFMERRL